MPPNLREAYGDLYRIGRDPAADSWRDPWLHTIPTRTGEVYVHSETHAGVEVEARRWSIVSRLRTAGYRLHAGGEESFVFLVPWRDLRTVLPDLQPYRRRRLTTTQRERLAEVSARHRFARRAGADDHD